MTTSNAADLPLWWTDPAPGRPALEGEVDADVIVVGGGISGTTLAWTLVDQGGAVVLLESDRIAGAASGRNAGFLLATPAEPYAESVAMWGRAHARAVLEIGRRTHQRIAALVQALDIACDYRAGGSLRLAATDEEAEDIRASLPLQRADGFPMDEVPLEDVVTPSMRPNFRAAFRTVEDGELHPVRFLHGLATHAATRGARLFEHSPVVSATWCAGVWEVRTPNGLARARTLVIATNAWAARLCPALDTLIVPRRGQMLATAPLDRVVAAVPTYAHWGYRYWRQTSDRRLVIGGWRDVDLDGEVGYGIEPGATIQHAIEGGLRILVPEPVAIEHRWAGTMGFARDGRPLVGWLDAAHHLAICAGFTGHGMGMAAGCTLDLADLLSWRRAPGIASFDPGRFPELRQVREGVTTLGAAASER